MPQPTHRTQAAPIKVARAHDFRGARVATSGDQRRRRALPGPSGHADPVREFESHEKLKRLAHELQLHTSSARAVIAHYYTGTWNDTTDTWSGSLSNTWCTASPNSNTAWS